MRQQQIPRPQKNKPRQNNQWIIGLLIISFGLILLGVSLYLGPSYLIKNLFGNPKAELILSVVCLCFAGILLFVLRERSPHEKLRETARHEERTQQQAAKKALNAVENAPLEIANIAVLGASIDGDLDNWWSGPWTLLPELQLSQHGVLIGASGSGKTVTLLRIAYLAAKQYGYKVFFLDAKPSKKTAALFLTLMHQLGIKATMFPKNAYNGWNGDGNTIVNRLMAIETFSEPYYKSVSKRILNAICKPNPPRSSREFLNKLDSIDPDDLPGISGRDLGGMQNRYHGFFDTIEGQLNGKWSFDTIDAGYLLLDGTSLKEEAASLGRYLIEDFGNFCTNRKPSQDKVLLIIDEYSALSQSGADTANLFERIRESGGAILVAGQGYASMGKDIERMLDAASFYIVHRSAAPEPLTRRAGTIKKITESYQFGGTELQQKADTRGQVRMEEQPAIHPNQARQLATGEAFIISGGKHLQTKIAQIPTLPETQIQEATQWITERPASKSPAPKPPAPPAPTPPETL